MTIIDDALLLILLIGLPARALWGDLRRQRPPSHTPKLARYGRTILMGGALAGAVIALWLESGRAWRSLGFDPPFTPAGLARLAVAGALLLALAAARSRKGEVDPKTMKRAAEMMPEGRAETAAFIPFVLVVGCGWELLYRGYALWVLEPRIGTVTAVAVAAAAYAAAHGYKGRREFIGSLVAAFAFTIAYALSRSLWWLMLLHAGVPVVGLLAMRATRLTRRSPLA